MIIQAFIFSHLDYCNALCTCLSQSSVWLQLVHNTAACILTKTNRRSHITQFIASLHWLPVKFRIEFKILTLKAQHVLAPSYIMEPLTPYAPSNNLSSSDLYPCELFQGQGW